MKHGLHLKLGQQLTMTPALQQAIRLLQLSSLEIRQEVQEALDSNLMLEEDRDDFADSDSDNRKEDNAADNDQPSNRDSESLPQEIGEDSLGDYRWEDVYDGRSKPKSGADDMPPLVERVGDPSSDSLQAHLHWQLDLARLSIRDQEIAEFIIDSIDDDGYLQLDSPELTETLNEQLILEGRSDEPTFSDDEILYVLHRVQQFDPPGIAARTPQECLELQLAQQPESASKTLASTIVARHLEKLAKGERDNIQRQCKCSSEELADAITLIRSLSAHPGAGWNSQRTEYVVPDVFIYKHNNRWHVRLNGEYDIPLRINQQYASLASEADNSADGEMMRNHLQEARWLIKSLQSRNETLVRVAEAIVERQQAWFDQGDIALTPMVLRDIADELGLHESTISRATSSKHMHTASGIVPFKHFFSSHVGTQDGGEASSIAIQAMIKELVANEPATKPLSDTKLANALAERNIKIARRTIAKYREALGIAPSHERKRLD